MILQTGSVCKQHEFLRKLCLSDGRIQTLLAEFEGLAIRKHQAVVESPAEPCASSLAFGVRYFMTITLPVMMPRRLNRKEIHRPASGEAAGSQKTAHNPRFCRDFRQRDFLIGPANGLYWPKELHLIVAPIRIEGGPGGSTQIFDVLK